MLCGPPAPLSRLLGLPVYSASFPHRRPGEVEGGRLHELRPPEDPMLKAMTQQGLVRACRREGFLLPEAPDGIFIKARVHRGGHRHRGSLGGKSRGDRGQQLRSSSSSPSLSPGSASLPARPPCSGPLLWTLVLVLAMSSMQVPKSPIHWSPTHWAEPLSHRVICLRLLEGHVFILVQSAPSGVHGQDDHS